MTVRTRIAPSPTGAPHIGTAYNALFNYAFAKSQGGQFILRIEDTDQARSSRESEEAILSALTWVGLAWDEGPDIGGSVGPYRQSERKELYKEHCKMLVQKGAAYPCFCTPERLTALRKEQASSDEGKHGYDGLCAGLAKETGAKRMTSGEAYVIRLRVPNEGECVMRDRLRGEVRIPWDTVDHQVLLKSDGFPLYHLANVVDDHLMGITHVIRGEEWLSSTPKHVLLYQSFGWEPPEFVHLPLLRNPDKSKLSKRKNPTSILYYQRAGIMPEALINYLGLMAYSMPDGNEIFTLDQLTASFDIDRVSLGGPIFDIQKLRNFNGQHLRDLSPDALYERLKGWMLNDETWKRIVPLAQPRLNQFSDLVPMASFFFADKLDYASSLLLKECENGEQAVKLLRIAQWELEKTTRWNDEGLQSIFTTIAEKENLELKSMMLLFFVAMTGCAVSLPIFNSMEILGRDMVLRRIQYALELLETEGITLKGKALKALTSYHKSAYETQA